MLTAPDRKSRFLGHGDINVSFEFFPPRTAAMEETLWRSIRRLEPLRPSYVSVTYGAGGSTRERTHATVARVLKETKLKPAAHLTCVDATREEVDAVIRDYWDIGVRHIVALRGDPAGGVGQRYVPTPGGYINAADLTRGIKNIAPFDVSVACYPEKHPELPNIDADIDMLWQKIDAGASIAITQFFFDNEVYFRYLDRVRDRGITIPIVPGIIPIHNFKQVSGFAAKSGASVPGAGSATDLKVWMRTRRRATPLAGMSPSRAMARRPRHHRVSLLHAEPRRPRLRHLPSLGLASRSDGRVQGGVRTMTHTRIYALATCSPSPLVGRAVAPHRVAMAWRRGRGVMPLPPTALARRARAPPQGGSGRSWYGSAKKNQSAGTGRQRTHPDHRRRHGHHDSAA